MKDPQTQLFVPSPDERATALHQEIDELSRRLHTIVDEAADAQRLEDEEGEELVPIRRSELRLLLDLASQSPDLVGRSGFAWDRNDPVWHEMGEEFSRRLLADLASRVDLSYSDFTRILGKIYGDDPDDLDDSEVELPEAVGATLVRAWSRSGRGYSERDIWLSHVQWSAVPARDAAQALDIAVKGCLEATLIGNEDSDGLRFWLESVAPVVRRNPIKRFEWLVEAITERLQMGRIQGNAEFISSLMWRWFCEIPNDDVRAVVRGLRALSGLAGSLDDSFAELSTCVADAWPRLDWGAVPCTTLSEVLGEAVAHGLAEWRTAELAHWFERVAPLVYPDLSDRLLWFVETVGKPHGDGPSLPEEINTSLTEYISAWLTALQSRPIEDIAVVVRAFRRTAMSACVYRPDIDAALDTLSEAY